MSETGAVGNQQLVLLPYGGIYRHNIQNIHDRRPQSDYNTGNPRLSTGLQQLFTGGNDRPAHNPDESNHMYIPGQH